MNDQADMEVSQYAYCVCPQVVRDAWMHKGNGNSIQIFCAKTALVNVCTQPRQGQLSHWPPCRAHHQNMVQGSASQANTGLLTGGAKSATVVHLPKVLHKIVPVGHICSLHRFVSHIDTLSSSVETHAVTNH